MCRNITTLRGLEPAATDKEIEAGARQYVRKISGGSRSPQGSKTRMTLFSLLSTWTDRGLNPFLHCVSLLQNPAPP